MAGLRDKIINFTSFTEVEQVLLNTDYLPCFLRSDFFVPLESMLLIEKLAVFRMVYSNICHIWALSYNFYELHCYSNLNAILKTKFDVYSDHLRSLVL